MNGTNNKKMDKQITKELKPGNGVSLKKKPKIRKKLYDRVLRAFIVEESSKVAHEKFVFSKATGVHKAENFDNWLEQFVKALNSNPEDQNSIDQILNYSEKIRKYSLRHNIAIQSLATKLDSEILDSDDEYKSSEIDVSDYSSSSGEDSEANEEERNENENGEEQVHKLDNKEDEIEDIPESSEDEEEKDTEKN